MKKLYIAIIMLIIFIFAINKNIYGATTEKTTQDEEILEGYYMIKSALDPNKVLDIDGIEKANEDNIQLWSKNQGTNQIFELIYNQTTKTYEIKSVLTGKVMDLYLAQKTNCTNVQLYTRQNTNWQKWVINKTTDGYYSIKSYHSGLYLDVKGNKSANGTNIEVYEWNGGKNQKFIFEKITIPTSKKSVEDGFFQIASAKNTSKVIDVLEASTKDKGLVGIWSNNENANQRFKVKYNTNGYYTIENVNSGLYLEADQLSVNQRKKDNVTMAQNWILEDAGSGYYYIISSCNNMYLTFEGTSTLRLNKKNGSNSQKFKFNKKANLVGTKTIEDGYYIISSSLNTNRAIDIEGASINAEAKTILWSKTARNNQKFKFTYDGNGYYTITSVKSKKVLDVAWAGKNNGSVLQQYTSYGNSWQKWIVEKNSDGTYSIISACSGLYIDIPSSNTKEGTNIILYTGNGGKNQKFVLQSTEAVEGGKTLSDGYYKIQTNLDKTKVLDVGNFSKSDHTKINLWSSNNGYNQRFKITYRNNGFYVIQAVYSGKFLDLARKLT